MISRSALGSTVNLRVAISLSLFAMISLLLLNPSQSGNGREFGLSFPISLPVYTRSGLTDRRWAIFVRKFVRTDTQYDLEVAGLARRDLSQICSGVQSETTSEGCRYAASPKVCSM